MKLQKFSRIAMPKKLNPHNRKILKYGFMRHLGAFVFFISSTVFIAQVIVTYINNTLKINTLKSLEQQISLKPVDTSYTFQQHSISKRSADYASCTSDSSLTPVQNNTCYEFEQNFDKFTTSRSFSAAQTDNCRTNIENDYGDEYFLQPIYWCDSTEFPADIFTIQQRRNGWVALYFLGITYMFIALAIICDDYFVPVLDFLIEKLEIPDDVAGATFMAAGGSAPELFTSIMGVFVAKSNVGIGTIVGSAVFNILFVIGMCAFVVGMMPDKNDPSKKMVLELTWYPLFRDCLFYIVSIALLIGFFYNEEIQWWEAMLMFSFYGVYVGFMFFNSSVRSWCEAKVERMKNRIDRMKCCRRTSPDLENSPRENQVVAKRGSALNFKNAAQAIIAQRTSDKQILEARSKLCEMINLNTDELNINQQISMYAMAKFFAKNRKDGVAAGGTGQFENGQYNPGQNPGQNQAGESENEEDDENNRDGSSMSIEWPEWDFKSLGGVWEVIYFLITFPITLVLKFIPDMKFKKVKNIWNGWIVIPSFVFCLVAITGTSYCMVWWTTRLGETWNVDSAIMGLTLLAAGTSIPDLLTSVIVAKNGFGDMALSSSVGSNIFDVTVGLPLPWMIGAWVYGKPIDVSSNGLTCSIALLLGMLVILVLTIMATGWKMNNLFGGLMIALYLVFVVIAIMLENGTMPCVL